jgi:hypothetical protein
MFIGLVKNVASAGRIKHFSTESLSVINVNSLNMLRPLCAWEGGGPEASCLYAVFRDTAVLLPRYGEQNYC